MFAQTEDPRGIGLFRCVFGILLTANALSLAGVAEQAFGAHAISPADPTCPAWPARWSVLCTSLGGGHPQLVLVALVASSLCFAAGLGTRVTKWLTLALFLSFLWRSRVALAGDTVFSCFLFILCLSPCGEAVSVDAWLRRRRGGGIRRIPVWPRWLLVLQLCFVYAVNGWAKVGGTWAEGTSVYYMLANIRWYRFEPWDLLYLFGTNLFVVGTWLTWWFERLFPLSLLGLLLPALGVTLPRAIRWVASPCSWAVGAVVLMGAIALLTNVGWFVVGTAAIPLCLFSGDAVGRWIDRRTRRSAHLEPASEPGARARILAAGVVLVHGLAIVDGSAETLAGGRVLPGAIARPLHLWRSLTFTHQNWRMFSPSAPRVERLLVADYVLAGGEVVPAPDDRSLLLQRDHPYLVYDRRQKIYENVVTQPRWQAPYARWVCRSRPPELASDGLRVRIQKLTRPLPAPVWLREHGPGAISGHRPGERIDELISVPCTPRDG